MQGYPFLCNLSLRHAHMFCAITGFSTTHRLHNSPPANTPCTETLHANLVAVKDTFDIVEYAVFDQFPWTPHIESGVYLQRKAGAPRPPKSSGIPDVAPENTAAPQGVKRKAEGVEAAS